MRLKMGYVIPGPLCVTRVGPDWIDSGTLARTRAPTPGPIGLEASLGDSFGTSAAAAMGRAAALSWWTGYIASLDLSLPPDRGALWSKLFDEPRLAKLITRAVRSGLTDGEVATALAAQDGRCTLESRLARTDFWKYYKAAFPDVNGRPAWNEHTIKPLWRMLSERFASGLEGDVVAYVYSDEVINAINAGTPPILKDELRTIQSLVRTNGRITSVTFEDIWTKKRSRLLSRAAVGDGFRWQ